MSILKVARMGHPILQQPTGDLSKDEICSPPMQQLADNMVETMREYEGVGLAAPQVHFNKRLLVVEATGGNTRYSDAPIIPLMVLFNFHIINHSKEHDGDWEGCLSIPGLRGFVPRYRNIEVKAVDRYGKDLQFKASGFFARVLQHEGDHLDGIMFTERMDDLKKLVFIEEFHRFHLDETEDDD
jgi:peptide deformylase